MNFGAKLEALAVLARAAGLGEKESLTIAYASQYVDDSTENKPIQVGESFFDPARTAHFGLSSLEWNVQKLIYIPFHFLPSTFNFFEEESFITVKNSKLANDIVRKAFEDGSELRLHRIGIALHTFADTWAHKNFSGRHNKENNVQSIQIKRNGRFRTDILKYLYNFLPQIGHGEAGHCPDLPFIIWRYIVDKKQCQSDNIKVFLEASETIYNTIRHYCPDLSPIKNWSELMEPFQELFSREVDDLEKGCQNWQSCFSCFFKDGYDYHRFSWRKKAFEVTENKDVDWDDYSREKMAKLKFDHSPAFLESDWVRFHQAARIQRGLVVGHL